MERASRGGGAGSSPRGRLRAALALLALVASLTVAASTSAPRAFAAPGDLDPTFDDDGIAVAEISSFVGVVDATLQSLPDDGGQRLLVLTSSGQIWRFLPDGTLDVTFDDDGVLPIRERTPSLEGLRFDHLASYTDGRFVVGGDLVIDPPPTPDLGAVGVARFAPDGELDGSFGAGGLATVSGWSIGPGPCETTLGEVTDLALQPGGGQEHVVASVAADANPYDGGEFCRFGSPQPAGVLLRFDEGGDESAGSRETTTLNGSWTPAEVVTDDEGNVLVSADTRVPIPDGDDVVIAYEDAVGVARYEPDLTPDAGFDGGVSARAYDAVITSPLPIAVAADDSVAVAAEATGGSTWDLLRWDVDGVPAPVTSTTLPGATTFGQVRDLGITSSGDFAVLGWIRTADGSDVLGVGLHGPDGAPIDFQDLPVPGPPSVDVRPNRLVSLGGEFRVLGSYRPELEDLSSTLLGIGRLDAAGSPDSSFGPTGTGFAVHHGGRDDRGRGIAVRPDARVVVGGIVDETGFEDAGGFVLRYSENGELDPTFAPDPVAGIEMAEHPLEDGDVRTEIEAVALEQDEQVVYAGSSDGVLAEPVDRFGALDRLGADGGQDGAFNGGEVNAIVPPDAESTILSDAVVDDAGRVVAVGQAFTPSREVTEALVVRLLPDGTLDPSFGVGGLVLLGPEELGGGVALGRGVALDDAGRIVLVGSHQDPETDVPRLMVARLLADGSGDAAFAATPGLDVGVFLGPEEHLGLDVEAAGNAIVLAGASGHVDPLGTAPEELEEPRGFVARITSEGLLDAAFGTVGVGTAFPDAALESTVATGIGLDPLGQLVVTGGSLTVPDTDVPTAPLDLLVSRLLEDATPDPLFGSGGLVVTDIGLAAGEQGNDVALAPDGKIVVTGSVTDDRNTRVLTARYDPGEAALECLPDPTEFGAVELGSTGVSDVTCTAVDGRVRIDAAAIDPASPQASDFGITAEDCTGATLSPGDTCTLSLDFVPGALGGRTAALDVTHTTVTGSGQVAMVVLEGEGIGDPNFTATPNPVVFAERLLSTTSPAVTVTASNTGNVELDITGLAIVGARAADFAIAASTCTGATLAPGGTCTVDVTFTPAPAATLAREARLRFTTTAPGSPHLVVLRGSVTPPTLVLDPAEGPIETEVEATGAGFESGTTVTVSIAGVEVGELPGASVVGGGFVTTFTVPVGTPGGDQTVRACQRCDTPIATAATAIFTVTPRLFVKPGIGPPGFVTGVEGDGFAPGPVELRWSQGIGRIEVSADDAGELLTSMLIFHRDLLGERELEAWLDTGDEEPAATAPFLVVPGRIVPDDFAVRR